MTLDNQPALPHPTPSAPTNNDTAKHHQLIQSCQGLVRNIAWKIHRKLPSFVELDDLVAYGQLGLAQAASAFESAHGGQFTTYAYHRIRGAILDGLSQMAWFKKADFYAERYAQHANDVLELDAAQSSESDHRDLAEETNWFTQLTASLSIAYLASTRNETSEAEKVPDTHSPVTTAMQHELAEQLWKIVDILPGDAGTIIRASYVEGLTLTEIANKLGISKAWVSRLHAKTLQRLARSLKHVNRG